MVTVETTMPSVTPDRAPAKRVKIAWLSPLPPQRSGIANYSYWLIKSLSQDVDIHLFGDRGEIASELADHFIVHPLSAFPKLYPEYDDVIYHLGNHAGYHKHIYELAWNFPGTVVLHDYDLRGFMHEAFLRSDPGLFFQALTDGSGSNRQRLNALVSKFTLREQHNPMSHAIVNRSKQVIVHHRWVRDQFEDNRHVHVIPHFAKLNQAVTDEDLAGFKQRIGIKDDHFVLVCIGFLNPNKLPQLQIKVVERLLAEGYPVQLIFAGEPAPELQAMTQEIRPGRLSEHVIFTGYQTEKDYFAAVVAADVVINLRNPTMGEASGTLMHALAAGKPTIISDINQYREFPDKVCWKLAHDDNQEELLFEYVRTMLANVKVRAALARNASDYARNVLSLEAVSKRWATVLAAAGGRPLVPNNLTANRAERVTGFSRTGLVDLLIAVCIFMVALAIFLRSPVRASSDSAYTFAVDESLTSYRAFALNNLPVRREGARASGIS